MAVDSSYAVVGSCRSRGAVARDERTRRLDRSSPDRSPPRFARTSPVGRKAQSCVGGFANRGRGFCGGMCGYFI